MPKRPGQLLRDTILSGRGHVLDSHCAKVGSVGQVYLDDQTGDPSWVTVKTGLFGTSESFAPLQGASVNGNDVTIDYTKDQVKDAPLSGHTSNWGTKGQYQQHRGLPR